MGLKIFLKAIRLVFDNLGAVLRISLLLYLIQAGIGLVLAYLALMAIFSAGGPVSPWVTTGIGAVVSLLQLLPVIWIAVAWHRFILIDELPGTVLPVFNRDRLLAYLGYSLLLALIFIAIYVPVAIALALLARVSPPAGPLLAILLNLVALFALLVVGYRLGLILPASALGRPLRMGEAWAATRGRLGTFLLLAFLSAVSIIVLDLPAFAFTGSLAIVGYVWRLVVGWFALMVGTSVLTTLYGHFIERRSID
jgi:hypothetical protein